VLGPDASPVRTAVFIDEQRVPKDMEWDEADVTATHAVLYNRLGRPLATGRLLLPMGGAAKVGRMAVHRAMRGMGMGAAVLAALENAASERGDRELALHAQRSAEGFYRALGYTPRGNEFDEVGIPHIEMFTLLPRKQLGRGGH
jgi:predicted GNAT family N-acyltransferase